MISGVIVLVYIFMGGLTSAIYNEVLQFFLIVLGFLPLVLLGLHDAGGWAGLQAKLAVVATQNNFGSGAYSHSWQYMGSAKSNPMGVNWASMVMGLGFVLSFGYWCTDFLVVQRAMAANSMSAARRTPLIAAFPKMFFPFLVILPGMIAIGLTYAGGASGFHLPMKEGGVYDYDMAIPLMLAHYFPAGMLGLGLTALMASFMSGMAGNVTAFNTVLTYDIYQSYVRPGQSDAHYLWMGRMATIAGIILSVLAAYVASKFNNIMDLLQLVFAFVNAPLFATFMLGMFWRRTTGHGAFFGLFGGHGCGRVPPRTDQAHGRTDPDQGRMAHGHAAALLLQRNGAELHDRDLRVDDLFVVTILISIATTQKKKDEELKGLVYSMTPRIVEHGVPWYKSPAFLGAIVIAMAIALNIIFW